MNVIKLTDPPSEMASSAKSSINFRDQEIESYRDKIKKKKKFPGPHATKFKLKDVTKYFILYAIKGTGDFDGFLLILNSRRCAF